MQTLLTGLSVMWLLLMVSRVEASESKIMFDSLVHDFGKVKRGQTLQHSFGFENAGDDPLIITGVHTTCGCTVSEVDATKSYSSKERGVVSVSLDTSNFAGSIVKSITVVSNEKLMPTRNLTLKAFVEEEFSAEPPIVDFGTVTISEVAEKEVVVKSHAAGPWSPGPLKYNEKIMTVRSEMKGDQLFLRVALKETVHAGFLKETIYVKLPNSVIKELPILVRADVKGTIQVNTAYLEFGSVNAAKTVRRDIQIDKKSKYQVQSSSADININGTKVSDVDQYIETELKDNLLKVTLKNQKNEQGSVHGRITLHTDDPSQKLLSVDFYAFFNDKD